MLNGRKIALCVCVCNGRRTYRAVMYLNVFSDDNANAKKKNRKLPDKEKRKRARHRIIATMYKKRILCLCCAFCVYMYITKWIYNERKLKIKNYIFTAYSHCMPLIRLFHICNYIFLPNSKRSIIQFSTLRAQLQTVLISANTEKRWKRGNWQINLPYRRAHYTR